MLRIDGPQTDRSVGVTETDAVGIDPGEAGDFHSILVRDAESSYRGLNPF